jgi:uncharacterized membrane protein YkoI
VTTLRTLTCALLLAATLPASAAVTREDAATVAQRATGGRVLAVERADADGRPVWWVKVVTGRGDVLVILVDVATGRTQ